MVPRGPSRQQSSPTPRVVLRRTRRRNRGQPASSDMWGDCTVDKAYRRARAAQGRCYYRSADGGAASDAGWLRKGATH